MLPVFGMWSVGEEGAVHGVCVMDRLRIVQAPTTRLATGSHADLSRSGGLTRPQRIAALAESAFFCISATMSTPATALNQHQTYVQSWNVDSNTSFTNVKVTQYVQFGPNWDRKCAPDGCKHPRPSSKPFTTAHQAPAEGALKGLL